MKLLFVCNQNENRSKTAEELFQDEFETRSAGLYSAKALSAKELEWADTVIVMEEAQRTEIAKRFPQLYLRRRILSLDIPDIYHYQNPALVKELKSRMKKMRSLLR